MEGSRQYRAILSGLRFRAHRSITAPRRREYLMTGAWPRTALATVDVDMHPKTQGRFVLPGQWALDRSSVAIVLRHGSANQLEVLYIRRVDAPGDPWSGQVCFPGAPTMCAPLRLLRLATRTALATQDEAARSGGGFRMMVRRRCEPGALPKTSEAVVVHWQVASVTRATIR
jgi:hypothetical protein